MVISILLLLQSLLAQKFAHFLPLFDIEMVLWRRITGGRVCHICDTALQFQVSIHAAVRILRRQRHSQVSPAPGSVSRVCLFLCNRFARIDRLSAYR